MYDQRIECFHNLAGRLQQREWQVEVFAPSGYEAFVEPAGQHQEVPIQAMKKEPGFGAVGRGTMFAFHDDTLSGACHMNTRPTIQSSSDKLATVPDTSSPAFADAHPLSRAFDAFASLVTRGAGSPAAFCLAVVTVVAWVVTGPIFHYSDGWQLVINTGTTIVTFLMVFLIQQSQNKDSVALHLKLNELLASHRQADNHLIGIEDASEDELRRLAAAYLRLSTKNPGDGSE